MIDIEIKLTGSKKQRANPDALDQLDIPKAIQRVFAADTKKRVRNDVEAATGVARRVSMLNGLKTSAGPTSATNEFRGVSAGRARGSLVRNAVKAETVLEQHGIHVLEIEPEQEASAQQAVDELVRQAVDEMLPLKTEWSGRGPLDKRARKIVRAAKRGVVRGD